MLLNLSDVLKEEGKSEQKEVAVYLKCFDYKMGSFEIVEKTPLKLLIQNVGTNKAKIEGNVNLRFAAACDRCLKEVPVDLLLRIERIVTSPEARTEDDADDEEFMEGYQLDIEALIYLEIVENWPVKILCKEDCKGVCPRCGQDLNVKDCGCDTFIPDPRLAAIKDIFESNKEV